MSEPDKPPDGTLPQSPTQAERVRCARDRPQVGQPVPNREMWVLERELGIGGYGAVWLAKHEWKDERVAVKFCTHPAARHQLVTHEKKVIARVMRHGGDHPNVVPLLDCNLSGETPWLIYEYVPGGTLAHAILEWKLVPLARRLARAVRVLHALGGALGTFHRLDPPIVHRDMKPHNVLMAGGRVPRITDFGLGGAQVRDAISDSAPPPSAHSVMLPTILHAMGTTRYAPPEQMLGSPPDPRDDVYALGIIAYQMVFADLKAVPGADAKDELRALRVPKELLSLIVQSVAINPDRRLKDATEWEQGLAKLLPTPGTQLSPSLPAAAPEAPAAASPTASAAQGATPSAARAPTEAELLALAEADFQNGENAYHGRAGMPQDYALAREWYERAAARGHAAACYNLGVIYYFGYGVPPNLNKASEWYLRAAAQGHAGACYNVGLLFERGRGVSQDLTEAREWYSKAAELGHAGAQNNLGVFHDLGRGVPQNYTKALQWYEKAAEQGHAAARYNLGVLFDNGRGVLQDYKRAREWYEKAAEQGHPKAQYNLGLMYDLGRGVPQDYTKALQWYEKAAAQGDAAAQSNLGVLYELGRGAPRDYEKARAWYEKAAAQGYAKALAYLGELHENGLGVTKDLKRALELYRQAAERGDDSARRALARLERRG